MGTALYKTVDENGKQVTKRIIVVTATAEPVDKNKYRSAPESMIFSIKMTAGPGAYRSGALLFFRFGSWAGSSFFVRLLALFGL